jgi:hypothetical protein
MDADEATSDVLGDEVDPEVDRADAGDCSSRPVEPAPHVAHLEGGIASQEVGDDALERVAAAPLIGHRGDLGLDRDECAPLFHDGSV